MLCLAFISVQEGSERGGDLGADGGDAQPEVVMKGEVGVLLLISAQSRCTPKSAWRAPMVVQQHHTALAHFGVRQASRAGGGLVGMIAVYVQEIDRPVREAVPGGVSKLLCTREEKIP